MRPEAEAAAAAMAAAVLVHPFRYSACAASASPGLHSDGAHGRASGHGRAYVHGHVHGYGRGQRPAAIRADAKWLAVRGKGRTDCQNNPVTSPSF